MRTVDIRAIHQGAYSELRDVLDRFHRIRKAAPVRDEAERRWMAAMVLVEGWTVWERFAENLIHAHVNHDSSHLSDSLDLSLPNPLPYDLCVAILSGNRYLDFRGSEDLKRKGSMYVGRAKNPFRKLHRAHEKAIDEVICIRNHILHRSRQSTRSYREVTAKHGYARLPRPGVFLLSRPPHQSRTRLQWYLNTLHSAVRAIQ